MKILGVYPLVDQCPVAVMKDMKYYFEDIVTQVASYYVKSFFKFFLNIAFRPSMRLL